MERLKDIRMVRPIVYGLPRGGVVLSAIIAEGLGATHEVLLVKKIGHPASSEYAIGAVAEGGEPVWNESEQQALEPAYLVKAVAKAKAEIQRRRQCYRQDKPLISPAGRTAVVVDDGAATGWTIRAALAVLRAAKPAELIVALPVLPGDLEPVLTQEGDRLVAVLIPDDFWGSVGSYYVNFPQVSDEAVLTLLKNYKFHV